MLGPKLDGDGRAGQALAAPSAARAGVVLIVRKPLAVPANRERLTRAGLRLLPTRSIVSRSTPAQLRSPRRPNRGQRCGAPRTRRIGCPDGAYANRCHRIVSHHRARWYGPVSCVEPRRWRESAGSGRGRGRRDDVGAERNWDVTDAQILNFDRLGHLSQLNRTAAGSLESVGKSGVGTKCG